MNATLYQRNADGGVINPPIIPEYEARIVAAMHAADYNSIARVTAEYNAERDTLVKSEEGDDSTGLGWSAQDMRGGLPEGATGADIRPRFPDGGPVMPAGMNDAQLAELQQARADMREMRAMMATLIQQGAVQGQTMDAPTPSVEAAKPLGATTVTAGPADKPTPSVVAATPLGSTGVTAGPADPPNPTAFPVPGLVPGGGNVATGAPDVPGDAQ